MDKTLIFICNCKIDVIINSNEIVYFSKKKAARIHLRRGNKMGLEFEKKEVKVDEIMIDPYNPRFSELYANLSQEELLTTVWKTQQTKELLASMEIGLKWVNNIVVRRVESLPYDKRQVIKGLDKFKYIIIEGNTRLACLKHERMKKIVLPNYKIPVLVAENNGISDKEFENEIQLIQAMSNVMVVKEWGETAKFRHIYKLYLGQKSVMPNAKFRDIVKIIKDSTSGKEQDVKKAIFRCKLAEEIAKESTDLEDEEWGYLEAFEMNAATRKTVGMNKEYCFEWEENEDFEIGAIHDLINLIPEMIKAAKKEGINTKDFRDKYREIVSRLDDAEDIIEEVVEIMDENSNLTWRLNKNQKSDREIWKEKLDGIISTLKKYPVNDDWANDYIVELENIERLTRKLNAQVSG